MSDKRPTLKMKKGVRLCEELLNIKCEDNSFDGIKKFLDEYMPQIKDMDIREHREPSEKQEYAIDYIENVLEVEFTGKTMKEASQFISEYYDKAKEVSESRRK